MTFREFIKRYAYEFNLEEPYARAWITTVFDCLYDQLTDPEVTEVHLPFIGVFKRDYQFPRLRYNVNTREYTHSPERTIIVFKPSKKLDEKLKRIKPDPELANFAKKKYHSNMMPMKRPPEGMEEELDLEEDIDEND